MNAVAVSWSAGLRQAMMNAGAVRGSGAERRGHASSSPTRGAGPRRRPLPALALRLRDHQLPCTSATRHGLVVPGG